MFICPSHTDVSAYTEWIRSLLSPRSAALLIIDMQNDFLTGSLALRDAPAGQDGLQLIQPMNAFLDATSGAFDKTVYSIDWHPANHVSFLSNAGLREHRVVSGDDRDLKVLDVVEFRGPPAFNQTLWPDHCVQGSDGAKLYDDLKVRTRTYYTTTYSRRCELFRHGRGAASSTLGVPLSNQSSACHSQMTVIPDPFCASSGRGEVKANIQCGRSASRPHALDLVCSQSVAHFCRLASRRRGCYF